MWDGRGTKTWSRRRPEMDGETTNTEDSAEEIDTKPDADEVGIRLFPDGDKWCALIGENIQDGIAGFGDTKVEAIAELSGNMKASEPLPCHYCGGMAVAVRERHVSGEPPHDWCVRCRTCDARGPRKYELLVAVAEWNRVGQRAPDRRLQILVDGLGRVAANCESAASSPEAVPQARDVHATVAGAMRTLISVANGSPA
jgi:hypothetical protein